MTPSAVSATTQPLAGSDSLYERLLGPLSETLHPAVQRLHLEGDRRRVRGTFRVRRGGSMLARVLAVLLRLPRPGAAVPVVLEITSNGDVERWCRRFGSSDGLLSSQRQGPDGTLLERYGPLELTLAVSAHAGGLQLVACGAGLTLGPLTVALPRRLVPDVRATVTPAGAAGVLVDVRIVLLLVGLLLHYDGTITEGGDVARTGPSPVGPSSPPGRLSVPLTGDVDA